MFAQTILPKIITTLFLIFASGCSYPPSVQVSPEAVAVNQTARSYRLVVPHGLAKDAPVVVAWHGFGDTAESMAQYTGLDGLAARHQFLLVYPEVEKGGWRYPRPGAPNTGIDADVEFFDALLGDLSRHASIDLDRIYVVGMSQGATFVQWLAIQRARDIAAVVAHSGGPPQEVDSTTFQVPIMLIAGTHDHLVHDALQKSARDYGAEAAFVSVPGLGHAWSNKHNEAIWTFLSRHKRSTKAASE